VFQFNQLGDLERSALRSGIARYRTTVKRRYFRGDAPFTNPEIYDLLKPRATAS
jgi:hypothetical protein